MTYGNGWPKGGSRFSARCAIGSGSFGSIGGDKGKVVKKGDRLVDATRYLLMSGLEYAVTEAAMNPPSDYSAYSADHTRSPITGY